MKPVLLCALALLAAVFVSACGTVATPEWAAEAQATRVAQVATDEHLTAIAPTLTPTSTPTETLTPTFTPLPPTETPIPTATSTPIPPTATATVDSAAGAAAVAEQALAAGDPANGQVVFTTPHTMPDGVQWMCSTCHSVDPNIGVVIGPPLWNIAVRAEDRVSGQNALEYIHNSIVNPQDFIAPLPEGQSAWGIAMPHGFGEVLSEQELNDVIAYLFTLRDS